MKISKLFNDFIQSEKTAGILLILCAVISLALSNFGFADGYTPIWHTTLGSQSIEYWINDGLMTIFFFADRTGA